MDLDNCPLPEVAEALGPFIKPRNEVSAIRLRMHKYLQDQLQDADTPLSSINLTSPALTRPDPPPAALSGVRRAYWKTLQAHATAQAKYDALRTELEQLKRQRPEAQDRGETDSTSSINENYVPLLRQRERYRKLKVLEKAVTNINLAGGGVSSNSVDDVVKKRLADLPTPPGTQPSLNRSPEVEAKIMELKKAVVSNKRRADERSAKTPELGINGDNEITPLAEIAGLQKALQELTSWMENQLTLIASAEAESQPAPETSVQNCSEKKPPLSTENVESLYEKYLEARQRLVETVNEPPEVRADTYITDFVSNVRSSKGADLSKAAVKSPAETMLPYISTLLGLKQEEQALMQQNSYIRHQVSTAEADTERLIRRLADESHLVQPSAKQGKDWAEAARETGEATDEVVTGRLDAGEASASSAKQTLESIRKLPQSLNGLLEKA